MKEAYSFVLPRGLGFETSIGTKIKGVMRLSKVKDFIQIQQDSRVKENPSYFYLCLLTRVVTKLGTEKMITTATIGKLTPEDFSFLVDFFNRINHGILKLIPFSCDCGNKFYGEVHLPGEV